VDKPSKNNTFKKEFRFRCSFAKFSIIMTTMIDTVVADTQGSSELLHRLDYRVEQCRKYHARDADEAKEEFIRRYRAPTNGKYKGLQDAFDAAHKAVMSTECAYAITEQELPQSFTAAEIFLPVLQRNFFVGDYEGAQKIAGDLHEHMKRLNLDDAHGRFFTRYAGSMRGPIRALRDAIDDAAAAYCLWWTAAGNAEPMPRQPLADTAWYEDAFKQIEQGTADVWSRYNAPF
jgi:hypothetical protein